MYYLLGLVGHPVAHSLSPLMHKAALAAHQLEGEYRLLDFTAAELAACVKKLPSQQFVGFNVTVPHKLAVLPLLNQLTVEAEQLRAINTVKILPDGTMVGHNTDLAGFMAALTQAWTVGTETRRAAIAGAGGAARAAVLALARLGWKEIVLISRRLEAAEALVCELLPLLSATGAPTIISVCANCSTASDSYDLLVNCTPVGLYDTAIPPWLADLLGKVRWDGLFFDMVYRHGNTTPLVQLARARSLPAADGITMLAHQAALAFQFWTGKSVGVEIMLDALGL